MGEVSIEVRHCLLALPGVAKNDLRRIMSHPQALSQCDGYIRQMRGVAREAVLDTAGAAQDIARHEWRRVPRVFSGLQGLLPRPADTACLKKAAVGAAGVAQVLFRCNMPCMPRVRLGRQVLL